MGLATSAKHVESRRIAVLEANGINHFYADLKVIDGASLQIFDGESVAIVGPSGAGKSTLLRIALGIERPAQGQVSSVIKPFEVGAAFQEDSLLPWLTVTENMNLLHALHSKPINIDDLQRAIVSNSLQGFTEYFPLQLSSGMRQKVALARLLLYGPRLYALDEAMSNIDDVARFSLCDQLLAQVRRNQSSIVFVTHSLADALHLADRVLVVSGRPLRVIHEFSNPLSKERDYSIRFTAEFQKAMESLRLCIEQL